MANDSPKGHHPEVHDRRETKRRGTPERRKGSELFVGPLPHPDTLREYDEISPGAAKMIFERFEEESKQRHRMERRRHWTDFLLSAVGLVFAFTLFGSLIGGGIWLIAQDKDASGLITLGGTLAGAGFIYRQAGKAKQDEEKKK